MIWGGTGQIWDPNDANPMHRRIPGEVVVRRRPEERRGPQAATAPKKDLDEVVVELRTAIKLNPDARAKWLHKACKMVADGKTTSYELYNIVVSRKFASGLPERIGRKLGFIIRENLKLFSDKQQRYLTSGECPLMTHITSERQEPVSDAEDAPDEEEEKAAAEEEEERAKRSERKEKEKRESLRAEGSSAPMPEGGWTTFVREKPEKSRKVADERQRRQRLAEVEGEAATHRAAEEERARKQKLEEEADNIFSRALVPVAQKRAPGGDGERRRVSRSVSARRKSRSRRRTGRPAWEGHPVSGSRALMMNRDFVEDLPHLPRPPGNAATGSRALFLQAQQRGR